MFSEEEIEILNTLLTDLQNALKHNKAKHVVKAVQDAYMKAAFNRNQIERHRQKQIRLQGSNNG